MFLKMAQALGRIAGLLDRPVTYAGGERGESEAARIFGDVLLGLDTARLSGAQLDHLGRILAGGLAGVRHEELKRAGVKVRRWKPGPRQPGVKKHAGPCYEFGRSEWLDHPSVRVVDGDKIFTSEPYELGPDALRQLVQLLDAGWVVRISGNMSPHFPGATMCVLIEDAKQQQERWQRAWAKQRSDPST